MSTCLLSRGLSGPCRRDSSFPRTFASPAPHRRLLPASCKMRQCGLSSGSRRPRVKKASPDRPPSIVVNGEGEEDAALAESVRSAGREIVADDSDGVVIDVENQNADRTEASDGTAMETNLVNELKKAMGPLSG
ncbi:probable starch synthase 4, chloroplastic/amyloplastic isoform X2 [Eucalyptus grandis]|uniref:probable starch synthase 4, chloroplastic/amyloplastic isoform X2 n=1 Tax=Eucalyptus grandis TaxID=71139 RepID=UPI0008A0EEC8|nr:probable starch synthase 4, chloroplastic/amyloplastic isoform X2 [Eucalyptus grandis]